MKIRTCRHYGIIKTGTLFVYLFLACGPLFALTPTAYPGGIWMQSGRDTNLMDGTNAQGFVQQGVEVLRLDNGQRLKLYGKFNWRYRSLNPDYYNNYTPYIGADYTFKYFDLGVDFGWPTYTGISNINKDYSIYAGWYRYWSLKSWSTLDLIKALPLSLWGSASYDLAYNNGSSTMGWIRQDVSLLWLPHNIMAGPFAEFDWRLRGRNPDYFNYTAYSAGLMIGSDVLKFEAKYSWRSLPKLNRKDRGVQLIISLNKGWDLMPAYQR